MRFLRVVSLVLLWSMLTAAPSLAVTYSWPVPISQPVTLTNLSLPGGTSVTLFCYVTAKGAVLPMGVGTAPVPVSAGAGGGVSYSGTISVAVNPAPGGNANTTPPPQSGYVASCALRTSNGAQLGSSNLPLP